MSTYRDCLKTCRCPTLVELLRWRSLNQPDNATDILFIRQERMDDAHLTYGELDQQAR